MTTPTPGRIDPASVILRPATPADTDDLLRIINEAYAKSEGHVFPGSTRTQRTGLEQTLSEFTIAEIDSMVVGGIHITMAPPRAHYGPLAVDITLQAGGLGSLLIEHAEQRAREAGCTRMCIEVVKQAGRIAFYERRGYRVLAEHDGQVWNGGADWGAAGSWQMVDMEKEL